MVDQLTTLNQNPRVEVINLKISKQWELTKTCNWEIPQKRIPVANDVLGTGLPLKIRSDFQLNVLNFGAFLG